MQFLSQCTGYLVMKLKYMWLKATWQLFFSVAKNKHNNGGMGIYVRKNRNFKVNGWIFLTLILVVNLAV